MNVQICVLGTFFDESLHSSQQIFENTCDLEEVKDHWRKGLPTIVPCVYYMLNTWVYV